MADMGTKPPEYQRPTARAGTVDPFKKDSEDQAAQRAADRAKGESKREASAPPGGRRLKGTSVFTDYQARQADQIDKESQ